MWIQQCSKSKFRQGKYENLNLSVVLCYQHYRGKDYYEADKSTKFCTETILGCRNNSLAGVNYVTKQHTFKWKIKIFT